MHDIKDLNGYLEKMDITLPDKLFWVSRITHPVSQLIDVRCTSGALLKAFHNISPGTDLIEIEESGEMIERMYNSFDSGESPFVTSSTGKTRGFLYSHRDCEDGSRITDASAS